MKLATESISAVDLFDTRKLISSILVITFSCEAIGAVPLGLTFVPQFGLNGIFIQFYLCIGILQCRIRSFWLSRGIPQFAPFATNPAVLIPVAALIIFGGLGFVVWYDVIMFRKSRHLILHTKVVLITTLLFNRRWNHLFFGV